MSRFAFLLSNNEGLSGVKKDVADVKSFLMSCRGGAWKPAEILERQNFPLSKLRELLGNIRAKRFDYVMFYYSGHGSFVRGTTLDINATESIPESETQKLSTKQLSLFDCCRYIPPTATVKKSASVCDEALNAGDMRHSWCRMEFDRLVRLASPQQVRLYACRVGECANATASGSLYTQGLLSYAYMMGGHVNADPLMVHNACRQSVFQTSTNCAELQNPDSAIDGLASNPLPFVIKTPNVFLG